MRRHPAPSLRHLAEVEGGKNRPVESLGQTGIRAVGEDRQTTGSAARYAGSNASAPRFTNLLSGTPATSPAQFRFPSPPKPATEKAGA